MTEQSDRNFCQENKKYPKIIFSMMRLPQYSNAISQNYEFFVILNYTPIHTCIQQVNNVEKQCLQIPYSPTVL